MPIYEYKCPGCEHKFEKLLSKTTPQKECPKCGELANKTVSGFIDRHSSDTPVTRRRKGR